jgi:aspartyl-tRNA(Asn)/glutamyl-tRNA(Gln) amidotransferase subunit C
MISPKDFPIAVPFGRIATTNKRISSMKISREEVSRVAELAHLELSPEEIDTYRGQLDEILTYVDKLKELDVEKIEPMAQVLFSPVAGANGVSKARSELREDVLRRCDTAKAILAQAADAATPFFRVPKVIER